ncbi:MAG: type IV pilus assembly protein PilY1, partial [Polyangiales bacterium]
TPIAGMLSDVADYFVTHPDTRRIASIGLTGDPFNSCRNRYAILLTDGQPTSDMRGEPYNCDALAQPVGSGGCPYETPIVTATRMLADGVVDGLYVVGFNVSGDNCPAADAACRTTAAETVATLNDLAAAGGTTNAIFADDRGTLIEALTLIMDAAAPGTTTRTVPAFGAAGGAAGTAGQLQFNTGFNLSTEAGTPWSGVLERRRIECDGLTPTPRPIEDRDRFHVQLNNQTGTLESNGYARRLLTIVPSSTADYSAHLIGTAETQVTADGLPLPSNTGTIAQSGLEMSDFRLDNLNVSTQLLDVASNERRQEVIEWVHGFPGTEREGNRLGSIYHSSPTMVSAPSTDILDEGYNLFRQRPEVSGRPSMVYVGSNDGILHGFVGQDHTFPLGHPRVGQSVAAGEELWGFIPPMLLRDLDGALDSPLWMVDGTPLVRDIFFARDPAANDGGDEYHTVLVNSMRAGGDGFIALDVTDPVNPEFLWQYTDNLFGNTYGQAAMGQVLIDMAGRVHERGIVILPGGHGTISDTGSCDAASEASRSGRAAVPTNGRNSRRCWNRQGRGLVVLDAASGRILRRWGRNYFPAPLNGGVSVFLGETGTAATRAFFTDADGVIWRLDLSNSDRSQWGVEAFHDIFEGMAFDAGQPAYSSPILSTNQEGDVVLIQGTGDIDRLENYTVRNRVVSVREEIIRNSSTGIVESVEGVLNWRVTLDPGEQVTGPVDLFQGNVYFGSFSSTSNSLNACEVGYSRIWGLEYLNDDGSGGPMAALESTPGSGVFDRTNIDDTDDPALLNQIVMGVAVTQRPTCIDGRNVTETDPYAGSRQTFRVDAASPPSFELVAQLSGGGTGSSGASVGEFTRTLPAPIAYTQTVGYAGTVQ